MRWLLGLMTLLCACESPQGQWVDLSVEHAAEVLTGTRPTSPAAARQALSSISFLPLPRLELRLNQLYSDLVQAREHGAWALEDRVFRNQILCHELCQCVSDRTVEWAKSGELPLPANTFLYRLRLTPGQGTLSVKTGHGSRAYLYHQTTLLKSLEGQIAVFDPILFQDAELHPLHALLDRIEADPGLRFAVMRAL